MRAKEVDGWIVQIGLELPGQGRRVYIDQYDITEEAMSILGPRNENGHGMEIPRGDDMVMAIIENCIRHQNLIGALKEENKI